MLCGQPAHAHGVLEKKRSVQSCLKPTAGLLNSCVGRSDKRNMHGFSRAQKCTVPEMGNADRAEPPHRNKTVSCRFEDDGEKQSPDKSPAYSREPLAPGLRQRLLMD